MGFGKSETKGSSLEMAISLEADELSYHQGEASLHQSCTDLLALKVPYTGIISFECTIDHTGPMAKTVSDTALLLQAIAGPDGIDDRQPPYLPPGTLEYYPQLKSWVESADSTKPLNGMYFSSPAFQEQQCLAVKLATPVIAVLLRFLQSAR